MGELSLTMVDLNEIELGHSSYEFICKRLTDGNGFARYLHDNIDLESGKAVALLPKDTPMDKASNFSVGGVIPSDAQKRLAKKIEIAGRSVLAVPKPDAREYLTHCIQKYICCDQDLNLLVEINLFDAPPPYGSRYKYLVSFSNEPYYYLSHTQLSAENLMTVMTQPSSHNGFLGFLFFGIPRINEIGEIDPGELHRIAEQMKVIITGAYDGESFLIWRRGGEEPSAIEK